MTDTIKINFLIGDIEKTVEAKIGTTVLEVAELNNIPIHGACDGNGACGTCCANLTKEDYKKAGEPSEEEEDTLERVNGATPTSRLSCQIKLTKEMNNLHIITKKD